MSEISQLSPKGIWQQFDAITQVPRPSKKEGQIIEWLVQFAEANSLEYRRDKLGNIVILKGATEGFERCAAVVLQSHMDMVCEKNSEVDFDFEKDAIQTYIKDGWVRAKGTTLGADCGIGMAAALAVLVDSTLQHPAIEALFTVDEESGLTGAFGLEQGMIEGRYLINLDSEDEGEIFIGCAGGVDTIATFEYSEEAAPAKHNFYRVDISSLLGGHSGDDINKGRGNANKLLGRILMMGQERFQLRLSYMDGGNLRNAIPREAYAVFAIPKSECDTFMGEFKLLANDIKGEYAMCEPNMEIAINEMPELDKVLDMATQTALLRAIIAVANGVLAMSQSVEGLVETSTNLASIKFGEKREIVATTSQRSSSESAKHYAMQMVESTFLLAGASVQHSDGYPGWNPNPNSKLLQITQESYRELFGEEPKVKAIHAGLECGLFLEKFPQLDMVSVGPTLRDVHSPDERLEIDSVTKFWDLLCEMLKRLE